MSPDPHTLRELVAWTNARIERLDRMLWAKFDMLAVVTANTSGHVKRAFKIGDFDPYAERPSFLQQLAAFGDLPEVKRKPKRGPETHSP